MLIFSIIIFILGVIIFGVSLGYIGHPGLILLGIMLGGSGISLFIILLR